MLFLKCRARFKCCVCQGLGDFKALTLEGLRTVGL